MISCQNEPGPSPSTESGSYLNSKILVIDDQPVNVALLQAVLADSGYHDVQAITDSRTALEVCETFGPNLVLLDLMMPHIDGFAILEALASRRRESAVPVMVLTADENKETRERAMQAGADDFILKPFNLAEVLVRIQRLLEMQQPSVQVDGQPTSS